MFIIPSDVSQSVLTLNTSFYHFLRNNKSLIYKATRIIHKGDSTHVLMNICIHYLTLKYTCGDEYMHTLSHS